MPHTHPVDLKLPAVSGASGRLVVERPAEAGPAPNYPGQAFANPDVSYAEAMRAFLVASAPLSGSRPGEVKPQNPSRPAQIRELRQAHAALRTQRRDLRQTRHEEDVAWRTTREALRDTKPAAGEPKVRARWGARKQHTEKRRAVHAQRQQCLETRKHEDAQWRASRQAWRERMKVVPLVSTWIAVLLITDNCTRQCLGLPLFVAGAHVTADMVVAALRPLLPDDLQFLISDRGIHFTAQVFQQLALEAGFVHVVIARHRPQSNGIAERFVRTLKEWLADKTWSNDQELLGLLNLFRPEFNDRPHQGLPVPGLSPNEYAKRIWLM